MHCLSRINVSSENSFYGILDESGEATRKIRGARIVPLAFGFFEICTFKTPLPLLANTVNRDIILGNHRFTTCRDVTCFIY